LGYVFGELKRWIDAEEAYKNSIKAQKDFKVAYLHLARLYSAQALSSRSKKKEYLQKAISTFEALAKLEEHDSETYNSIGYLYIELDNTEGAVHAFECALESNPENALAAVNLATIYLEAGRNQEARLVLKPLVERDPGVVKSYLSKITKEAEANFHLFMDEVHQKLGVACLTLYLSASDEGDTDGADRMILNLPRVILGEP
jgi:tetratricopeptide (TPR) repeat protein